MSGAYIGRVTMMRIIITGTRVRHARARLVPVACRCMIFRRLSFTRPTRVVGSPAASDACGYVAGEGGGRVRRGVSVGESG